MKSRRRHEKTDIDPGDRVYPSQADLVWVEVGGYGDEIPAYPFIDWDGIYVSSQHRAYAVDSTRQKMVRSITLWARGMASQASPVDKLEHGL